MTPEDPVPARMTGSRLALALPALAGVWLLWTSLSEPFSDLSIWDGKRLLEVYFFPVLIGLGLLLPGMRRAFTAVLVGVPRPLALGFGAFLLLGVVSALRLNHPGYALAEVSLLFLLALGALTMAASRLLLGAAFDRLVLLMLALLCAGVFVLELVAVFAYLGSGFQYSYLESLIRFGHPRMYNQVQTWTLPLLALLPIAFPGRSSLKVVTPVLIGMHWYILVLTGARGSMISLVVGLILVAVLAPGLRKTWFRHQALGLLVGLLFYAGMTAFMQTSQPEQDSFVKQSVGRPMASSSGRDYLWELALKDIQASPLLGAGPAMFACDTPWPVASSPHNFPLQVLSEWGIPAFLLLGAVAAWAYLRLLLSVHALARAPTAPAGEKSYSAAAFTCLAAAVTAALVHAQVSGLLIAPASHMTGVLVLGWIWGLACSGTAGIGPAPATVHGKSTAAGAVLLAAGLVASLALAGFARSELNHLEMRTAYAVDYGPAAPRFWRDGRVCLYRWIEPES